MLPCIPWSVSFRVLAFFGRVGLWIGVIPIQLFNTAISWRKSNLRFIPTKMLIIAAASQLVAGGAAAQTPMPPAALPTALVTFFSDGDFWTMGKHGKFKGQIFDGNDRLANLTAGHFITFKLDAGGHVFAANSWLSPTPTGGGHLKLDLIAGQHYYLAAYLDNRGVLVPLFRLEQPSCDQVQKEAAKVKPLDRDELQKYGQDHAVIESGIPICTESKDPQLPPASGR